MLLCRTHRDGAGRQGDAAFASLKPLGRITSSRGTRARRGGSAAELALVLPLLVTAVLACIDLGRFTVNYIAVTNASRAGAGFGSVNIFTDGTYGTWQADVKQAVIDEMSTMPGFNSSNLTVNVTGTPELNGLYRVQVDVSYPFQTVVNWPAVPHNLTLSRTVVLRGLR
jgi:Flp pilus assembly protein TadG